MRKILVTLLVVVTLAILFTGCGSTQTSSGNMQTPSKPINIGTLPAESAIPIIVAKEKGFFQKEGVEVNIVPFNSPDDRNVAVQANKIDGTIADVMTALSFNKAGIPMQITSDINENFKLLTSPHSGIDSFAKLNNKDVSLVPNFVLEYIMDKMAEKNNIRYKVVSIPSISARFQALLTDKISGVVFTEPQATMLAAQGAKVLATSDEYGLKAGAMVFNKKFVDTQPDEIKAFYKGYNDAIDYINKTDASEYGQLLSKYGFPDTVGKSLKGTLKFTKADMITKESFDDVLKWTKAKGMVSQDYKYEDITNFKYIN